MLAGREGKPGSGKSYETVKVDLCEALKQGRKVYARINGLDHAAIAAHLGLSVDGVRSLLVVMNDADVVASLVCDTLPDGSFHFPCLDKGALVIVDECQDFWPVGRGELPERVGSFFAKHRHWGLDVVIMSQDFRELHRSVLRRLDKKNQYTKLDALGRDNDYSVRFLASSSPGKFTQVGVEKRSYDPAIFPLYDGVQPGVESATGVYKVGTKTLWKSLRIPALLMLSALLVGIYLVVRFFIHPSSTIQSVPSESALSARDPGRYSEPANRPTPAASQAASALPALPSAKPAVVYPPGIAYVHDLLAETRPRYLGVMGDLDIVEFRERDGDRALERLTSRQLVALGFEVARTGYGFSASWGSDLVIVFTPWPIDPEFQQSQQLTSRINATPLVSGPAMGQGTAPLVADDPAASGAAGLPYGSIASYGGMGVSPASTGSAGPR